jgi:hypothetical protein
VVTSLWDLLGEEPVGRDTGSLERYVSDLALLYNMECHPNWEYPWGPVLELGDSASWHTAHVLSSAIGLPFDLPVHASGFAGHL